jgi:hypothetical protein
VEHDAKGLAQTLQTLIDWIVEINYPGQPSPRLRSIPEITRLDCRAKDAIANQVPVSRNRCTRCMGIPKPADESDTF